VSVLLIAGTLVILFVDRHARLPSDAARWSVSTVLGEITNVAVPVIGVVLASRRRENPLGWMFLTAGFALALGDFATGYGLHALMAHPGSLPAGHLVGWLSNWSWTIPNGMLVFLFLLFPSGRLPSRRWRPVALIVGAGLVAMSILAIVYATLAWSFPFGPTPASGPSVVVGRAVRSLGTVLLPIAVVVAVVSLIARFRGSAGDERLQLKWFVTAAAVLAVTLPIAIPWNSPIASLLSTLAFLFVWAAIVIAVLKYRLYEIDVVISRTVVFGSLAVFITIVYVGLVVGVGTAVGNRRSPLLSAVAAGVIAVAFQPVRARAQRLANRVVYGRRATPYEVLSDFAERISGAYSTEDVLPRMAQIVAAGTGAARAVVWVRVGNELHAGASSDGVLEPDALPVVGGQLPAMPGGQAAVPVLHREELLGAISIRMPPSEPLSASGERLIADVASQAGLVLSNVRLIEELRASRQRLVAAQDAERRKLERNLHDGAQQQLVALAIKQRLAAGLVTRDPEKATQILEGLQAETAEAIENLRDLARGIYPPLLADQGLAAALTAQARKATLPVDVEADGIGRYPQDTEAAVYFCCLEALQNVAKYADATSVGVRLSAGDGLLAFEVEDDGKGFDPERTPMGSGLQNMADRLAALGGSLEVRSRPGEGVILAGRLPARPVSPA
jgi:signal transduction histidine kinase